MTKIFNSTFEISMRSLLILYVVKEELTLDAITSFDLLTTYGKNYGISKVNLHGDNSFSFSELAIRRKIIQESLNILVLDNLIIPLKTNNGFQYKINLNGINFCQRMSSEYAIEYIQNAKITADFFNNKSEKDIITYINTYVLKRSE